MLSDIFGLLEIDDEERGKACAQWCTPSQYLADIENVGWFLCQKVSGEDSEHERELVNHRAAYFYHHKELRKAFEEYKLLLNQYKHSRTHSAAIIDSLIRCALKIPSTRGDDLLRYLHEYKECILDCGGQLQYLALAKDVYAHIGRDDAPRKFVEVVCLLCATTDLPEHWLAFGERKLTGVPKNLHVGYITRAIMLLERQMKSAHGFVIRAMENKLKSCNDRLAEMGCSEQLIQEARQKMGIDLFTIEDNVALSDSFNRPPHECRLKSDAHVNDEDLETVLKEFKKKFAWMFDESSL
ncbi:hypothetical protein KIN20_000375 [Parelaphostrongylus tenuis]|uniref:Uncharacterized protein n=1 Tax=Parelaphostrongylus tenuis TaxID=148309 RepID=A0AAD5LW14_PARTN|nr:hypothetical protein KIN20_000375 [Parelaphostrongylus tenuis]